MLPFNRVFSVILLLTIGSTMLAAPSTSMAQTASPTPWAVADYGDASTMVHAVYLERDNAALWLQDPAESLSQIDAPRIAACCAHEENLNEAGRTLLRALIAASRQYPELSRLSADIQTVPAPDAESLLTKAYLALAAIQNLPAEDIRAASGATDRFMYVRAQFPANALYWRFAPMRQRYQTIAEKGGWPQISTGTKLTKNMRDPRVAELRANLAARDLLITEPGHDSLMFDDMLEQAVKNFQRQQGLETDGIAGKMTVEALNVPVERRLALIALNQARAAQLPDDGVGPHILVNIPGTELVLFDKGSVSYRTKVIVGRPDWPTPLLSGAVSRVEFNPAWNVPDSILSKEMMPRLQKDAIAYLAKENLTVYDFNGAAVDPVTINWNDARSVRATYRLRQNPGDDNALGQVKINFPNNQNIYLHDTNNRKLFAKGSRYFSHGCIRVENVVELVERILVADPKWNRPAIDKAIASGRNQSVPVKANLPIQLIYLTAWMDADGTMQFRDDPYCQDPKDVTANARCSK